MRKVLLIMGICSFAAIARTPEGPLAALLIPNDARPAMGMPGGSFEVVAVVPGTLHLVSTAARIPLQAEWTTRLDGKAETRCSIPQDAAPGVYALEWSNNDEVDTTPRAIFVSASDSDQYSFVCLNAGDSNFQSSAELLKETPHRFALIFLDGGSEQFLTAMAVLATCPVATYVVWSATDQTQWVGPPTYAFTCGPDAYLGLDAGRAGLEDSVGAAPGAFAKLRRAHKKARWAVALLPQLRPSISMRNTMTLFVDDPVHTVICGSTTDAPVAIDWAGWYEPIPVFAPRREGITYFSATLRGVSPFVPKPAAKVEPH